MTHWSTQHDVLCPTCGRALPKLNRQPINEGRELAWDKMIYIERRLIAGLVLDHVRVEPYRTWTPKQAVAISNMKYRQVHNALRRLVPCGWVKRLTRGNYRLTELAVNAVSPAITSPRMTLAKLQDAQVP